MRIDGSWLLCDDGVVRPIFRANGQAADGSLAAVVFLADSAADRTVLAADILAKLGLAPQTAVQQLGGVGGTAKTVVVDTKIHMPKDTGALAVFTGKFAAFTDLAALDMSVLGRDITNHFALIVDRPQDVVCLIRDSHRYNIVTA